MAGSTGLIAGAAFLRSLCAGIRTAAADSAFVLCLDDDAMLHRSTIADLVCSVVLPASQKCGQGRPLRQGASGTAAMSARAPFMATGCGQRP